MGKNYYSLVAGLREYSLEADNKGFDAPAIVAEVREQLSGRDAGYLALFYTFYDIENILSILGGRTRFSELGNFSREELEAEVKAPERLPRFIADVLLAYAHPEDAEYDAVDRTRAIEKALYTAYYDECRRSRCRFIREWYEFDRNVRNVSAAYTAKRLGLPVADQIVGGGYVAEAIARSSAADFGLRGELEYIDRIMAAVAEEGNLLDKEHMIDLVRWETADELTTFDYFDIDHILGYLVKVNLVHRWATLDPKYGREMFQRLIASLRSDQVLERAEQDTERKINQN